MTKRLIDYKEVNILLTEAFKNNNLVVDDKKHILSNVMLGYCKDADYLTVFYHHYGCLDFFANIHKFYIENNRIVAYDNNDKIDSYFQVWKSIVTTNDYLTTIEYFDD